MVGKRSESNAPKITRHYDIILGIGIITLSHHLEFDFYIKKCVNDVTLFKSCVTLICLMDYTFAGISPFSIQF